jgi:hypothetical protein
MPEDGRKKLAAMLRGVADHVDSTNCSVSYFRTDGAKEVGGDLAPIGVTCLTITMSEIGDILLPENLKIQLTNFVNGGFNE